MADGRVRGGCGLCSREITMAGEFRGGGRDSNVRRIIGECNCRFLDALAGEFKGPERKAMSGICNGRFLDALAGEFRWKAMRGVLLGNAIVDS